MNSGLSGLSGTTKLQANVKESRIIPAKWSVRYRTIPNWQSKVFRIIVTVSLQVICASEISAGFAEARPKYEPLNFLNAIRDRL